MTRNEFLKSIIAGAAAVKAVGESMPDGSTPKATRLLAIEYPDHLTPHQIEAVKAALAKYQQRYGIEFMIFTGGMRLVDPLAPPASLPEKYSPSEFGDITNLSGDSSFAVGRYIKP